MAIVKLWSVYNRLDHVLDYAMNKDKTEEQFYVSGINCLPEVANEEFYNVKNGFNKANNKIIAFHATQSFVGREVSPEKAHEIGMILANEIWWDRFQVVVTTHLDKKNIHNHFVINSTSFVDGKAKVNRYVLPEKQLYYSQIEKLSKLNSKELQVAIDDPILSVLNHTYNQDYIACGAGINNLGISSDGDIYPCIFLREKLGNLQEENLIDIWNSSKILENLRMRKIEKCGECKYKYSCGGCRAFSGIYNKDDFCPL